MKNTYKLSLAAIAASLSLVGCGGSSDSTPTTVTGQFVDTYVSGLNYACSSGATGVTNNMGEYTCNEGDTVEFSLGGYLLGSTTASEGIVTPETLYPDNADAALNVAQVIQSFDTDPTDDIISIDENFTALDDVNISLEDENFDALIADEIDVPLVTEDDAQDHLDETELMLLLAGKTFYNVGSDWIDRMVFNADITSVTWEQIVGDEPGITGTDSLILDGDQVIVTSSEDGSTFNVVLGEETADYLVMNIVDANGAVVEVNRFYFDQAAAEAYYESLQPEPTVDLVTLLAGKTFYNVGSDNTGDNWIDSVVFNADATSLVWTSLTHIETGSHTVVIEGNTITLNGDEGDFTLTFVEEDNEKLVFHRIEGGVTVEEDLLFFDQAVAQAYYDSLQSEPVQPTAIDITQSMLDGKTFYGQDYETDQNNVKINDVYAQMTFSNGVITRTELYVNVDTQAETFLEFTLPYTIIDGKVRADLSQFNEGYGWFTLNSESVDAWNVTMEDDQDMDGVIDAGSARTDTWYLSKPLDYPDSL